MCVTMKRWFNDVTALLLIFLLFTLAHFFFVPLHRLAVLSDDFNKVAIGIAALITAYFGTSYFREELYRRRTIKEFREKYAPDKHGKTYKLIESDKSPGAVFLFDLLTQKKHHIWNMKTMYDLGWQTFLPAEVMQDNKFQAISTGEPIRTRGELGE
jgi:hypothetical protein